MPETNSAEDYQFGFNIVKMITGAVGELAGAAPNPCPWDLEDDGSVGVADLLALLSDWGPCEGCPADFDGDGSVGLSDLLALLASWGACP